MDFQCFDTFEQSQSHAQPQHLGSVGRNLAAAVVVAEVQKLPDVVLVDATHHGTQSTGK